jgi:glycosyltransferase involved in cell wall biosynthesis
MKILHVAPAYYPATYWGGPTFSTYALCNSLAALPEVELRVLTCDSAGPSVGLRVHVTGFPIRFPDGYDVYFTRRVVGRDIAPGLIARLWGMIGWADVVLLTATYSFPTIPTLLTCRLRDRPLVWSPRGALQASHEWSLARHQSLKRAFEQICRIVKPRQCVLHVTAEAEKQASLARLPGFRAAIIPNAVEMPAGLPPRIWTPNGVLRLLFLSRLDPKKGLENLLAAMASLDPKTTLDVYGTGDPSYVRSLKKLTADLGLSTRVRYHGHVDGHQRLEAFINADLFVLPTHSENFGMVVAEALAHGVPTVVSRGAPWPELESRDCGLWVCNEPESLALAIESLREVDLAAMGRRGRAWMQEEYGWAGVAQKFMSLCTEIMAARQPESVE